MKPSAAPVNIIGGVGSGKETVIPASERKVVFNGIEPLFSFHKESFLPALEAAAASLMVQASSEGEELDADGQLSIEVTKGVAGIFLKHAAFMKMYSSYIKYVGICHCGTDLLIPPSAISIILCKELNTGRPTEPQQGTPAQGSACRRPTPASLAPPVPFLTQQLTPWLTSPLARENASKHSLNAAA